MQKGCNGLQAMSCHYLSALSALKIELHADLDHKLTDEVLCFKSRHASVK